MYSWIPLYYYLNYIAGVLDIGSLAPSNKMMPTERGLFSSWPPRVGGDALSVRPRASVVER